MPEEMVVVHKKIDNLLDEKNSILIALEKQIDEITARLEESTSLLGATSDKLSELKKLYEEAKTIAPGFRSSLKPLISEKSNRLSEIVPINYDFSKIVPEVEAAIDEFMQARLTEIEGYKNQISSRENIIADLATQLKAVQVKLNTQKALVEKLKIAMKDSDLSKGQVVALLREFINENSEPLFSEDELVIACLLVMFGESINLEQTNGVPMSTVLADAFVRANLDPIEEAEVTATLPLVEEQPLAPIEMPTVVSAEVVDFAAAKKAKEEAEENTSKELKRIAPAKVIQFPAIENKKPSVTDAFGPQTPNFVDFDEDTVDFDEDTVDDHELAKILSYLENGETKSEQIDQPKTISYTPEAEAIYAANLKLIQSLELKGDTKFDPITFYNVPSTEVDEMVELANACGVKLRTIEDLAALCRTKGVERILVEAIEKNPEGLGNQSVSKIIAAADKFGQGAKATKRALKEYLGNDSIFKGLEDTVDNAKLGSAGYINLVNLLGMLDDVLEKNTYAYIINGKLFAKKRVEKVLTKLLASDVKATDEELLLTALVYDSQLGSTEAIAGVDNELHARLNADRGRTLGGVAA